MIYATGLAAIDTEVKVGLQTELHFHQIIDTVSPCTHVFGLRSWIRNGRLTDRNDTSVQRKYLVDSRKWFWFVMTS